LSAWLLSKEPEPPLLDASVRYAERAVTAGVDARLDVWLGMPHGFPGSIGKLKAAAQAPDAVGAFFVERLRAGT
jgi:epsilon-lactone hydrolase